MIQLKIKIQTNVKVISSCGSCVPLLISPSLSNLELTILTTVKQISGHSYPVNIQKMPSHWVVQLHWRRKSLPVYSYDHTLWAGLTDRFLEAGHLSFVHSTTHQITWNTMHKINGVSKTVYLEQRILWYPMCTDKEHKWEWFAGKTNKQPPNDDRIKLNSGYGIWHSEYILIRGSLACTIHLPFLSVFYIFIILNVSFYENKFKLISTNSELLEHVMVSTCRRSGELSRISLQSPSYTPQGVGAITPPPFSESVLLYCTTVCGT